MASSVPPGGKPKPSNRAILKDQLHCCADAVRAVAPRGEYEIEKLDPAGGECGVGLCNCATHNRFTLSYDAFIQHLTEGRIALARR